MLGIIAGSGLQRLTDLKNVRREIVRTPFGDTSCALTFGEIAGKDVVFLNRHGYGHTLAPHQINSRANLWAMQKVGVTQICAIGSAGALVDTVEPGQIILPDDVIDYTAGRANTYFEGPDQPIVYTDMYEPFNPQLRANLQAAAAKANEHVITQATYACTNGPRLETRAEVRRMVQDGATIVGMTLMPEAVLAKELDLAYAAMTVCTNYTGENGTNASADLSQWRALRESSVKRVEKILLQWVML
jgi:5'-methylthioadenosine phosphorylase